MRKLLYLLALLIVLLVPNNALALGDVHLSLLSVDIWPEYDQPDVLYIYRVTLSAISTLPASLALHIPSDAQINAVAEVDPTKGLVNIPYENSIQGQWSILKVTTDSLQVQVEYYVPLVKNGTARQISFEWAGDYAVDKLDVNFLKPFGAESISISLAPTDTSPGQDGLTNYHIQQANLAAGQPFTLTIDYQRKTDDLSISSQSVQAASTPGPDTPGRISFGILPWVKANIGILLIIAGAVGLLIIAGVIVYFLWRRGSQSGINSKKHKSQREGSEDPFTYCHHCGKRAQPGDVFCRACGSRLRR